ncbi:MAG: phosphopantothenoylcysteine decarboxylase [Isosphaeraceae bacterium]
MNVLVTGGGTVSPIDDVRSITNTSTGRFSATISEECLARGATVHHVHAWGAELPFFRAARFDLDAVGEDAEREIERLESLRSRYRAVRDRLHLIPLRPATVSAYASVLEGLLTSRPFDLVLLAMAVSDYEPEPIAGKIESSSESLLVRCRRTSKVIRRVRDWAPSAFLVGFKLLSHESEAELIRRAEDVCLQNRAEATVANDLRTLREGRHTVHLVRPGQAPETFGPSPTMAGELVERVFALTQAGR